MPWQHTPPRKRGQVEQGLCKRRRRVTDVTDPRTAVASLVSVFQIDSVSGSETYASFNAARLHTCVLVLVAQLAAGVVGVSSHSLPLLSTAVCINCADNMFSYGILQYCKAG